MQDAASLTPMFRQYRALKGQHPSAILLFRMGDFYEMFHDDAEVASERPRPHPDRARQGDGERRADVRLPPPPARRLHGEARARGPPRRGVRPGGGSRKPRRGSCGARSFASSPPERSTTPTSSKRPPTRGSHRSPSCPAAWARRSSTRRPASSRRGRTPGRRRGTRLAERLDAFAPREIVHPEDLVWPDGRRPDPAKAAVTPGDPYTFTPAVAADLLKRHFEVASLDGFGLADRPAAIAAAGGLLAYVQGNVEERT